MADEFIKVIDELSKRAGIAIDWSSKNALPYIQQICAKLVNYELATSIVWIVIALSIGVVSWLYIKNCERKYKLCKPNSCDGDAYFWTIGCLLIVCILCCVIIIFQVFDITKCCVFPEKIVFDELRPLIPNR